MDISHPADSVNTHPTADRRPGKGAAIDLRGLTWTPLGRRRPILDGIDLHIEPGERLLVAGASGAGKSTLLRAIAGVVDTVEPGALTGTVTVDDGPTRAGDGRVGLLVQDPADARVAGTIGRDIAFGLENLGVPRADIHRRIAAALAAVDIRYGPGHATSALSGGEAQRVALAGIIALRPRVVLLDEPTSMLDDASARAVREAVVAAADEAGATLVVVEHRLTGWVDVVDRLVVLGRDGRLLADGPVQRTLHEQTAELLAAGLWVPGAPAPEALGLPEELCAPWPGVAASAGQALVSAEDVRVVHRPRRGLRVIRRPEPDVTALDGVDLTLTAGRAAALRGTSGAGKSTLLGLLTGIDRPTGGQVRADAGWAGGAPPELHRWDSAHLAARVGWVPQRAELTITSTRSVRDCLLSTPQALGRDVGDAGAAARRIDATLDVLGLSHAARRHPYRLSGGEVRRLAVAGALVHGPALVAFDEPTVGQDRHTWAVVAGLVSSARDAGCAVVAGTHDDLLAGLVDDVHHLARGRLCAGPADPGSRGVR
ncbi:ABC transporter ATP-binding protein [Austwickia chelonae]|uniref:ABC transporter ATP-binding protein n=1 Tax=Austwickia chelonae TaxID=100225 RepID=UPI000E2277A6|nr:ATP-binding cassette domain-containing protein [Austwickia chelonae]